MNTQNENELEKELKLFKEELENAFSESKIERLSTDEIRTQVNRFKISKVNPIIKDIEQVRKVITSPINIGMLGRYSHGKTALVNALFQLTDECKLPEGEGVVTSKVTYASFSENISSPKAYKVRTTGEDYIDLAELQNCVSSSNDTSDVNYYKIELNTGGKSFATLFARNNINLVDMPGLGGPYFKDQVVTKKYIRELDMIVAVIRIDQIQESGRHINHLLEGNHIPVIPVLTFADDEIWTKSDIYSDCKNIDDVIDKAKNLIRENIPAIQPYIYNVIAVSNVTGLNIDALRQLILSNIETSEIAIGKAKKDIAPVYRRQLLAFQREYNKLKDKLLNLSKEFDDILRPIIPNNPTQQKDIIGEACKQTRVVRAENTLRAEGKRSIDDLYSKYKDHITPINYVNDEDSLNKEIDRLQKETIGRIIRECSERVDSCLQTYKDELAQNVKKGIDNLTLDNRTKDQLCHKVSETLDNEGFKLSDCISIAPDQSKIDLLKAGYKTKIAVGFFASMAKDPSTLILLVVGIILLGCGSASFFGIDYGKYLAIAGGFSVVSSLIIHFLKQPNEKRAYFEDLKRNIIGYLNSAFDVNTYKDSFENEISKKLSEIKEELRDCVSDESASYNNDAMRLGKIKEDISENINSLSNKLEDELCSISANR